MPVYEVWSPNDKSKWQRRAEVRAKDRLHAADQAADQYDCRQAKVHRNGHRSHPATYHVACGLVGR